ncbi:cyclic pyranopterin monophosphate synthase MoaC [Fusibacter bizertensis]
MLTHFNEKGLARMVEVTSKETTHRVAVARGSIYMKPETIMAVKNAAIKKGDVIQVAQIGGIMGSKKTSEIIPMCHPLMLTGVDLNFDVLESEIVIESVVQTVGVTGVEMEALTAVTIAALTIYDMCKAIDKEMVIGNVRLIEKMGGKSGHYVRQGEDV